MFCANCGSPLPHPPPVRCAACGVEFWHDPKPCAGATVTRDGALLLVQRAHAPWRGAWDVPGGFCSPDEHPIHTAEREVREETGLAVRVTGFLGIWPDEYTPAAAGGPPKRTLNIYYNAVALDDATVNPDPEEVTQLGWFRASELPEPLAFPGHIPEVLAAWSQAVRSGAVATPLLDRPT